MKYLPKSLAGAVMSALYLLLVFGILLVAYFTPDKVGLATTMGIFFVVLTLPLSVLGFLLPHSLLEVTAVLFFIMPFVGAFFNAAIIYLAVGYVNWALQSLSKRL